MVHMSERASSFTYLNPNFPHGHPYLYENVLTVFPGILWKLVKIIVFLIKNTHKSTQNYAISFVPRGSYLFCKC